jgi:hypothetical protein
MKEYLFQHSLRTILTQAVSSRPPQPGKGGKKTKNVSLGGGTATYVHLGWCMSRHGSRGGDMEKAYAKFGAWRASVRDTRLKEVRVHN